MLIKEKKLINSYDWPKTFSRSFFVFDRLMELVWKSPDGHKNDRNGNLISSNREHFASCGSKDLSKTKKHKNYESTDLKVKKSPIRPFQTTKMRIIGHPRR